MTPPIPANTLDLSHNELVGMLTKALIARGVTRGLADDLALAGAQVIAAGDDSWRVLLTATPEQLGALLTDQAPTPANSIGHAIRQAALSPVGPRRARLDQASWRQLTDLAFQTYVPETEDSRLAGAGAGLTDND